MADERSIDADRVLEKIRQSRTGHEHVTHNELYKYLTDAGASLSSRVQILENNEYKIAYFATISSGPTGSITPPSGAEILMDQIEGADAYVSKIDPVHGKPTGEAPLTSGLSVVDVSSFDTLGNYVLTGTPSSWPIALIYIIKVKAKDYSNLNIENIIEETIIESGGGAPGGLNTEIQFNSGGSFGGSPNMIYDESILGDPKIIFKGGKGGELVIGDTASTLDLAFYMPGVFSNPYFSIQSYLAGATTKTNQFIGQYHSGVGAAIDLYPEDGEIYILASSKLFLQGACLSGASNGDVLTLVDNASGEAVWNTPTGAGGVLADVQFNDGSGGFYGVTGKIIVQPNLNSNFIQGEVPVGIIGNGNTSFGVSSMPSLIDGTDNISLGYGNFQALTGGISNIAIGNNILNANLDFDSYFNTAIGYNIASSSVGRVLTNVLMLGANIGLELQDSNQGILIGHNILNTPGYYQSVTYDTFIGTDIGPTNNNYIGSQNIAIGSGFALNSIHDIRAQNNVSIGASAMSYIETGYSNVGIGAYSLFYLTSGVNNLAIGDNALYNTRDGINNTAVGGHALESNISGNNNLAIGSYALAANTNQSGSIAIGAYALFQSVNGSINTAIGANALYSVVNGSANTAIGEHSFYNTDGVSNIGIGTSSGQFNKGSDNIAIGGYAFFNDSSGPSNTASNNVSIGGASAQFIQTGNKNVFVGDSSAYLITTGSGNILFGYRSGYNLTTGSNNIAIGYDQNLQSATASYQLNIGNYIYGTGLSGSSGTISPGLIGLGVKAPTAVLHLDGSSTTRASLRMPSGAAPSSPNEGDLWNDSTQKALFEYNNSIPQAISTTIFTQTADKTVSNTVTETTLFGTGVGTLTLPANFFTVGKTLRAKLRGLISTSGSPTVRVQIKLGSTSVADSGTVSLILAGLSNDYLEIELGVTCRTTGSSGTVIGSGMFGYDKNTAAGNIAGITNTGTVTINTTTSKVFDVTIIWGTASASNSVKTQISTLEILN